MLVDIDKIVVGDRIRKDYGDIEELADDIQENGLINPPVVNKSYELLAGERRLRACKSLGWPTIEVRMMDTRDAEHELNIEISENDVRKGFTKSERLDYIRRLLRIEQAKGRENMSLGGKGKGSEISRNLDSDESTAAAFGISSNTMRREMYIADNKNLLDPSDFADWDEGKLSTNKAYQKIKAAQAQAERERKLAEQERDNARNELAEAYRTNELLETQIGTLKQQVAEKPKPEVIERTVEVPPSDYAETKRRMNDLKRDNERLNREYQEMRHEKQEVDRKLKQANELLGENERQSNARRDIAQLTIAINTFLRQYGGKAWAFDQFDRVDGATQEEFRSAIGNMAAFSQNIMILINERTDKRLEA